MTNIFGHSIRSELLLLFVAEGLICFLAFYLILAWGLGDPTEAAPAGLLLLAGGLAACSGLISGASGLYQPDAWQRARRLLGGIAVACLLLLGLAQLLFHAILPVPSDSASLVELLVAFAAALLLTRIGFIAAARAGLLRRRLVLVHASPAEAPRTWRADPYFEVVQAVPASADLAAILAPAPLAAQRISAVVTGEGVALRQSQSEALRRAGIGVMDEVDFAERRFGRVDLARLQAGWLAKARGARGGAAEAAMCRAFDLLMAMILLLVTLPVILLAAIAVKLDSPGPVFYRQQRVGRGGQVFTLFKFRSMVQDAEAKQGPAWATKRDPRITRIGRFLRLTRIDEVPQVFNVLRGDMAFVGPRPERPEFVARLAEQIDHYRDREVVKPGITGWAQVNYPYGASVEDSRNKLAYDLYYVKRRSLFLDLLILVATVRVVLFQEGSR
jgi:exopolysaccharide biosynthesis polyprenyl glycosylphosphotransferase